MVLHIEPHVFLGLCGVGFRSIEFWRADASSAIPAICRHLQAHVRPEGSWRVAQALIHSPTVDLVTDRKTDTQTAPEPDEAPETPPTEPPPAPVQDPPAEPDPSPYVVRGGIDA